MKQHDRAPSPPTPSPSVREQLIAHYNAGRFDAAEVLCRQTIAARPREGLGWKALGLVLISAQRSEEAIPVLQQALDLDPRDADTHNSLGKALKDCGRLDEALASYGRALELQPDLAEAHNNAGNILRDTGRLDEAETHFTRALAIRPDFAEAHYNLGLVFTERGRPDKALPHYAKALEIRPGYVEVLNNLGNALKDVGRLKEALACYAKALKIKPDLAEAHCNLGNVLKDLDRVDEALAHFARALELKPHFTAAHSNLLFTLGHHPGTDPARHLALARAWDRTAFTDEERRAIAQVRFAPAPRRGRRLRIGYLSGDFRRHAVSTFIEDILRRHDKSRLEVTAYTTCSIIDDTTRRFQGHVEHWVSLVGLSDRQAAEHIRRHAIDVLIDLSGHTMFNRLRVVGLRAAPVQAHYLGYFASTGLAAMDYLISDATVVPPAEDAWYTEKIWRLPRVWISYQPGDAAPPPAWRPAPQGRVWFGGFNKLSKITPASIALWSEILRRCPQGGLLLKTTEFTDPAVRAQYQAAFAAHGIAPERLRLVGKVADWRAHMALYDQLDVALDPVAGHCGVTTTCDALWMGVPVISLEGAGMVRRMCASILTAVGRPDWIAPTPEAYVDLALRLAGDLAGRPAMRAAQREVMARSPLCDSQGLVAALEQGYETMFDRWSEGTT